MRQRALRASGARTLRCCHLLHLPGRVHGDAQVCFVTLAFLAGVEEVVGESPLHSKPLGQATMVVLETQSYILIGDLPLRSRVALGESLPLSISLSIFSDAFYPLMPLDSLILRN